MYVRNVKLEELEMLKKAIEKEGYHDNFIKPEFINNIFVLIDNEIKGFFMYKMETGYPSLRHFLTLDRKVKYARELIKAFINLVKSMGYSKIIVNSDKMYMSRIIEYYFKVKPYAKVDNIYFYMKEV